MVFPVSYPIKLSRTWVATFLCSVGSLGNRVTNKPEMSLGEGSSTVSAMGDEIGKLRLLPKRGTF